MLCIMDLIISLVFYGYMSVSWVFFSVSLSQKSAISLILLLLSKTAYVYISFGSFCSITIVVVGNGHGDSSLNPR